ncbi:hypothetical protein LCGC14_0269390 [marine sediment metagenome]|uniref:Tetratricopeptide repeat protein n=1 Tax=marine sediment metagenome TaxID=412755 RepID=A0A0F9TZG9_9ZZZZ|nr:tetratricopeptide repeat protein [Phycisphaerae bacterium]HDZ45083.1 tetratricopeptide repeat protein [Phycisphaerae bacterium]
MKPLAAVIVTAMSLSVCVGLPAGCGPAETDGGISPPSLAAPAPVTQPAEAVSSSAPRDQRSIAQKLADLPPCVPAPVNAPKPTTRPAPAAEALAEARQLLAAHRAQEAIFRLERALKFAPNDWVIRKSLGIACYNAGQTAMAMQHLRRVVETAPDNFDVQVLLGRLYDSTGQGAAAMGAYRTALKCSGAAAQDPRTAEALFRLGTLLADDGQDQAALDAHDILSAWWAKYAPIYQQVGDGAKRGLRRDAIILVRGRLLIRLGRAAEAVELLKDPAIVDGRAAATQLLLEAIAATGQFDLANDLLLKWAGESISPTSARVLIGSLLRGYARAGRLEEGMRSVAALIAKRSGWASDVGGAVADLPHDNVPPGFQRRLAKQFDAEGDAVGPAHRYVLARLAEARGDWPLARDMLEQTIALQERFLPAYEALADGWLARGRADRAMRIAERLVDVPTGRQKAMYLKGKVQLVVGDLSGAVETLSLAVRLNDRDVAARLALAEAYEYAGRPGAAVLELRRALRTAPTRRGVLRKLLDVSRRMGQGVHESNETLKFMLKNYTQALEVRLALVESYLARGEVKLAANEIAAVERHHRDDAGVRLLAVEVQLIVDATADQVDAFDVDTDSQPPAPVVSDLWADQIRQMLLPPLVGTAAGHKAIGQASPAALRGALRELETLGRRWPNDLDVRRTMCTVLEALDRNDEALVLWRQLVRRRPGDMPALWGLAAALMTAEQYDELVTIATHIISRQPHNRTARGVLLTALVRAERYADADAQLTTWLAESQGNTQATWRLQRSLVAVRQLSGDYDRCRDLLDTLIATAAKQNDRQDAVIQKLAGLIEAEQEDQASAIIRMYGRRSDKLRIAWLEMLGEARRYEAKQRALDEWLKATPDLRGRHRDIRKRKVKTWIDAGQFDRAHTHLDAWLADKLCDFRDACYEWKVTVFAENGDLDGAIAYVVALNDSRQAGKARKVLLAHLYKQDRFEDIKALADHWAHADPTGPDIRLAQALLVGAEQWDLVMALLDAWEVQLLERIDSGPTIRPEVFSADPAVEALRLVRGRVLSSLIVQQREAEAAQRGQAYLAGDPNCVDLLLVCSTALSESGRPRRAEALLVRALQIVRQPSFLTGNLPEVYGSEDERREANSSVIERRQETGAVVLNNLGYLYAEMGVKLPLAQRLIREALAHEKTLGALDSLGWVFYKQGQFDVAVKIFDEIFVHSRHPRKGSQDDQQRGHPLFYDHTGDILYRQGDLSGAVDMWRKALQRAGYVRPGREIDQIRRQTPLKLAAVGKGRVPPVAPLGEGVFDPLMRREEELLKERSAPPPVTQPK